MAAERKEDPAAEPDASERPVREQLKKASISTASGDVTKAGGEPAKDMERTVENGDGSTETDARGRPQKKRSLEDVEGVVRQEQETSSARTHTRKRSRGSSAEEDELNNGQRKSLDQRRDATDVNPESHEPSNGYATAPSGDRPRTPEQTSEKRSEAAAEQMTSPKTKRSRLQAATDGAGSAATSASGAATGKSDAANPEDKEAAKVPPTSGFANTSASSPFASLSSSKSPSAEVQTSASTFAASGFSALTGAPSGFGAIGKTSGGFGTGGGFATGSKNPLPTGETGASFGKKADEASVPSTESGPSSTFGGALGQQSPFSTPSSQLSAGGFGSGSSGFGKVGGASGFGSSFGGGGFGGIGGTGSLTSFASGKPSSLTGSLKPAKPFGAPADENEEEVAADNDADEQDESGIKSPLSQDSDKQDERFYEQELETGEEDEMTEYSCRAKLYTFAMKKEWKERGLGVVRLNVKKADPDDEEAAKPKARLLMRAEGSHRVILNTPVKKEIKFGSPNGEAPQGGYIYFMGTVDGLPNLTLLQLKVRQQFAMELHEKITELQEAM